MKLLVIILALLCIAQTPVPSGEFPPEPEKWVRPESHREHVMKEQATERKKSDVPMPTASNTPFVPLGRRHHPVPPSETPQPIRTPSANTGKFLQGPAFRPTVTPTPTQ